MVKIYPFTIVFCFILLSVADAQLVSVDIQVQPFKELYAVEYRLYTEEPIGTVAIFNPTSRELKASVIVDGERYINSPMKTMSKLPAKQKTDIPLYIDLDVGVLGLSRQVEHVPISIKVTAYLGNVEVNSKELSKEVIVHDIHKMPEGDPAKVAMFVNPEDEYVRSELLVGMGKTGEEKASAAFNLLQKKGIYCVGGGSAQIQYPRELLRTKFGSFYDCSLLYSAILELLGVETQLVFNSETMVPLYKMQGSWRPVDMNMLSLNFEDARSSGERLQNTLASRGAQKVILREAWKKYPPLKFPELPPEDMQLLKSVDKYIAADRLEDAVKVFETLLAKYPDQPVLLNNAANVDLLMGNIQRAVMKYNKALERTPDDGGLYLNMGIAYHKLGDEERSIEALGKAYTKLGSYMAMCRLLNLDEDNRFYSEIDALLRKAVRRTTEVFTVALGTRSLAKTAYPLYWKRFQ